MWMVSTLAAGLAVCALGVVAAAASPALRPGIVVSDAEWHPSTGHWDHHFHAHQGSRPLPHLAEAGVVGPAPVARGRAYAPRPAWSGVVPAAPRD